MLLRELGPPGRYARNHAHIPRTEARSIPPLAGRLLRDTRALLKLPETASSIMRGRNSSALTAQALGPIAGADVVLVMACEALGESGPLRASPSVPGKMGRARLLCCWNATFQRSYRWVECDEPEGPRSPTHAILEHGQLSFGCGMIEEINLEKGLLKVRKILGR
jgi:hypothetical protein